jgi:hypothetical protein
MHSLQRPLEVLRHPRIRQFKRRAPADQHIIMPGPHPSRLRQPHDFPQAAADPIALDGFADLFRNGEADAHRAIVVALTRL